MSDRAGQGRVKIRRRLKRIPAVFEASRLRGRGELGGLSRNGLFFCTETLPDPGTPVRVVFSNHEGSKVAVRGEVRWNTTGQAKPLAIGFGMRIEQACDEYLDFYEDLLTG
jgi:hypothetical protein